MARFGRAVIVLGFLTVFAGPAPARASWDGIKESWDVIKVGTVKIGYTHVKVQPLKHEGRDLVNVQVNTVVDFKRGRDRTTMEVRYGTIETPEGSVLRLDTRMKTSDSEIRNFGDVVDGKMVMSIDVGGKQQQMPIEWGPDVRGPYGAEISLTLNPIKAGEKREIKIFVPELNKICISKLTAKGPEKLAIGPKGEKRELMRVDMVVSDAAGKPLPGMQQLLWVEKDGQVLRSLTELLGGTYSYRSTKAAAHAPNGDFDIQEAFLVKVKRKIPKPDQTRHVVYRVGMKGSDPSDVLPNDPRQSLSKAKSGGGWTLDVHTSGVNGGKGSTEAAAEEFTRPNPLVNSDDSEVIRLMHQAVGTKTDPWQKAAAIENWVFKNIRAKDYSIAFASATEVARNLEGDCTEHSVLTAAMCRAAGIPARVAIGLIYADHLGGFGQHMWNEVYVKGRWVAIDAAFDQTEVDAVHIKLSDTSLDGVAPFDAFMPVIKVYGKLTLEAIEIR
jgi:hypothetical protein